jgi:uncharacterized membrane protein
MSDRVGYTRRAAIAAWLLLAASVACWPFVGAGIGWLSPSLAFAALLLPLPGMIRASRRALGAAPMALAPALVIAITEVIANPPARPWAAATLALALLAFATALTALRANKGDGHY